MQWETVLGLEVHIQLNTKSKIFSGAATAYGANPNTQACAIDLGLPGVLPVLNGEAVAKACRFGLAINAAIARESEFDRKNYFYPDLPKGYQISQFAKPIVSGGALDIDLPEGGVKTINITRAHLEEDAGKSIHEGFAEFTAIDLNRAGTPLLEIVSEPELRSAAEAIAYLKTLHSLVKYLDICDGNMQEGSFRVDANVSVRPMGQAEFGTRAEIKNLNSFKFIEKAINYEVNRQIELISKGEKVVQETRLYDSAANVTRSMRAKEQAHDYRYFPDPDLLALSLSEDYIQGIQDALPELPKAKLQRFVAEYTLSEYEARILTSTKEMANYYEQAVKLGADAKLTANFLVGDFSAKLNEQNIAINEAAITATDFAGLIKRIMDDTISGKLAKTVFEAMWQDGVSADAVIKAQGLQQINSKEDIRKLAQQVLAANDKHLSDYRAGKTKLFGFFVGQLMKLSKGQANPELVNEVLRELLDAN